MLTGACEEEVEISRHIDKACACWQWEIDPTKLRRAYTSVKCLRPQWRGAWQDILSKVKNTLLHLTSPSAKKEAQCILGLFGYWRQHIPYSCVLLWPLYWVTREAAGVGWGPAAGPGCSASCSATRTTWSSRCSKRRRKIQVLSEAFGRSL